MKVIKNNAWHFKAMCPSCKSEMEVSDADKYFNSSYKKNFLRCPCCGHADEFACFVPHEEFMKRYKVTT